MSSETTMHAAVSSVNCGLFLKPSASKKPIDFFRSLTGRLTKIFVAMCLHLSQGNECAQPRVAQVQSEPDEHAEDDREEPRLADAHVRGDGAAEVAGQQDRAEHRRARDRVEDARRRPRRSGWATPRSRRDSRTWPCPSSTISRLNNVNDDPEHAHPQDDDPLMIHPAHHAALETRGTWSFESIAGVTSRAGGRSTASVMCGPFDSKFFHVLGQPCEGTRSSRRTWPSRISVVSNVAWCSVSGVLPRRDLRA